MWLNVKFCVHFQLMNVSLEETELKVEIGEEILVKEVSLKITG